MTAIDWIGLVFWTGLGWFAYGYVVFPLLVTVLAVWHRRRPSAMPTDGTSPAVQTVTVIIPAHNEERSIEARVKNILSSHCSGSSLEVIVVSDASSDGTNEIVARMDDPRVSLLIQDRRYGKASGLNRAVEASRGSVIVFTDANTVYAADTICKLLSPFAKPSVGLVTGYTRYARIEDGRVTEATSLYTRLERSIKRAETTWGACVGADGAIFAMRRELYRPLRQDDINDFVLPLWVVEQGYECILAEDAYCLESPGESLDSEFRRQSRITNRTLRALWRHRHLLNPIRFPAFSWLLFSHKVARFLVPPFLLLSGVSLLLLAPTGWFYASSAAALVVGLLLARFAQWMPDAVAGVVAKPLRVLEAFVMINAAMLNGWWRFLSGRADTTWQHDRSTAS